jgi:hypothetical protein
MTTTTGVEVPIITNASQTQKDTQAPAAESKPRATMYQKEIKYDRLSRDYAMYLDGELVGFARNYHDGEVELDQLVFELLSGGAFREAA